MSAWLSEAWDGGIGWLAFVAMMLAVAFAVLLLVFGTLAAEAAFLGPRICAEKTRGMNLASRYSFWGGCQVKTEAMGWLPIEALVVNAPESRP